MRNGAPHLREWKARVRARIGALHVDAMRETEIVDELAQHVAEHFADLTASGMAEADAIAAALAPLDPARVATELARADRPARVDRKSTRLNSSHLSVSRMPSSA